MFSLYSLALVQNRRICGKRAFERSDSAGHTLVALSKENRNPLFHPRRRRRLPNFSIEFSLLNASYFAKLGQKEPKEALLEERSPTEAIIDLSRSHRLNLRLKKLYADGEQMWKRVSLGDVADMVRRGEIEIKVHYRGETLTPTKEQLLKGLGRLSLGGLSPSVWRRFTTDPSSRGRPVALAIDLNRSSRLTLRAREFYADGGSMWKRVSMDDLLAQVHSGEVAISVRYREEEVAPAKEKMLKGLARLSLGGLAQSVWSRFTAPAQSEAQSFGDRAS